MQDPTTLFTYSSSLDQRTVRAETMLVTLGNYVDAGHDQRIINEHLLNTLPNHELGRFDVDQLFDYAGHRPQIVFDKDRFTSFASPQIALHLISDADDVPFLLLSGPEPSLQWERMVGAIEHVIEEFDVRRTVLLQTFPAPAPHTRPVLITRFASDPDLIPINSGLPVTFQMSASFGGLLTLRLGERHHAVVGLAAHVPQYLAAMDYPDAALALLGVVREMTGLRLPEGDLPLRMASTRAQVDESVAASPELQQVIAQIEEHHDALVAERGLPINPESLPSGDQIAAELEDYLRGLDGGPGGKDLSAA